MVTTVDAANAAGQASEVTLDPFAEQQENDKNREPLDSKLYNSPRSGVFVLSS